MPEEDLSEFLDIFITETKEAFGDMDNDLVNLEQNPGDMELIKTIFRRMHTIKGSASIFDFKLLKDTAHKLEDLMDWVKNNTGEASHEIIELLFEGVDHLKSIFHGILRNQETGHSEGRKVDKDFLKKLDEHMEKLSSGILSVDACAQSSLEAFEKVKDILQSDSQFSEFVQQLENLEKCFMKTDDVMLEKEEKEQKTRWFFKKTDITEHFVPWNNFLKKCKEGEDLKSQEIDKYFINLKTMVEILKKEQDKEIENVIVEIEESISLFEIQEFDMDQLMIEYFSSVTDELQKLLESIEPEEKPLQEADSKPKTVINKKDKKMLEMGKTVRVNEEKIDMFLNGVGELITIGEVFNYIEKKMDTMPEIDPNLKKEYKSANLVYGEQIFSLHESLIELRRVEIKQVLGSTPRLIRDLAKSIGKEVSLIIKGDDSYLDKSLITDLDAMILHTVRNAVDHGIETVEERKKLGKLSRGEIRIEASNDDKFLHVHIKDDGRGIDAEKIREVAKAKGIFSEEKISAMSEQEIINMIFISGMTTTKKVSEVSGRGVGMDIVLSGIEKRGGSVNITTEINKGTSIHLQIPLSVTLGVINGLVVKITGNYFVVPIEYILETFKPDKIQVVTLKNKGEAINVRNKLFPMIRLEKMFNFISNNTENNNRLCILIKNKDKEAAIWVDELSDQQQVVLKKLDGLPIAQSIMGGAIMGDGRVGLVLNVEGLLDNYFKK